MTTPDAHAEREASIKQAISQGERIVWTIVMAASGAMAAIHLLLTVASLSR